MSFFGSKKAESSTDSKSETLVDAKATEGTPLVKTDEPAEKTPVEQMQTIASLVALIGIAVLKTQLTAYMFNSLNYPTAYSLWTCIVTCVLLIPSFVLKPGSFSVPSREMLPVLGMIVVFTTFDLAFTNIALANISTALQQCIAATNPFWTIMIETALYSRFQHPVVYTVVSFVVVGAILTSLAPVNRINAFGVAAACCAVLCSASKYVFTHKAFLQFKGHMTALSLLFWVDLLMSPILIVWTLIPTASMPSGELIAMMNVGTTNAGAFWSLTGTAALGGVRALTQYVVLIFVTATSMSTANILTQILNICISIPLQHTPVGPTLISGILVVMIFSSTYAFIKSYKPCLPMVDEKLGCVKKA